MGVRRQHVIYSIGNLQSQEGRDGNCTTGCVGLLANLCLRWTFRRCFSHCEELDRLMPFEQNFGLLISRFPGITIARLAFLGFIV